MKSWMVATVTVTSLVVLLTGPVLRLRAQGNSSLHGLKHFEADCQKLTIDGSFFVCTGDLVGSASVSSVVTVGTVLGQGGSGGQCRLDDATDVITAADGSTLTLNSHGMICTEPTPGFAVRHNAYLIEGGTGRFQGTTGTGNIVHSTENPIGLPLIHIDGNINLR